MEDLHMDVIMYFWIWFAAALTTVAGLILLTRSPKWTDFVAFGAILAGLLVSWAILHPQQTHLTGDAKAVQAMIGQGKPVLLEFESPY
jgi:hypothetical protein